MTSSRSMGPPAVDAGIALTVYPSFKWMPDGYATPDLLPRTVEEVRLAVLPYLFTAGEGGGSHPLFSALDEYLYLKCAGRNQWQTLSTTYILPDSKYFDMVSAYANACVRVAQPGGVPSY